MSGSNALDGITIASDFDALQQLFTANQNLEARDAELVTAKETRNDALEYRNKLLARIGTYTLDRKAEMARMSLFDSEFKKNPRPDWIDGTTGGPGGPFPSDGPQAPA